MCVLLWQWHAWHGRMCSERECIWNRERTWAKTGVLDIHNRGSHSIFLHASIFYDTVFLVNIFFLQCVLCAILYAILLRSTGTTTQEIELVVEEESSSSKVWKKIISSLIVKPDLWTDMRVEFSLLFFFRGSSSDSSADSGINFYSIGCKNLLLVVYI